MGIDMQHPAGSFLPIPDLLARFIEPSAEDLASARAVLPVRVTGTRPLARLHATVTAGSTLVDEDIPVDANRTAVVQIPMRATYLDLTVRLDAFYSDGGQSEFAQATYRAGCFIARTAAIALGDDIGALAGDIAVTSPQEAAVFYRAATGPNPTLMVGSWTDNPTAVLADLPAAAAWLVLQVQSVRRK